MKYLKLFEDIFYEYEDPKIRIQKIKNGPNKGKINLQTKYFRKDVKREEWTKFSPIAGCVRLLATKYEKNPKIRNIVLDEINASKEIKVSTMDAVFRNFLSKLGYKSKEDLFGADSIIRGLRTEFGHYIQELSDKSKNLGDLMDGLREIEEFVEPYIVSKKYNL